MKSWADEDDERISVAMCARLLWPHDWDNVEQYTGIVHNETTVRCSVSTKQRDPSHVVETIQTGEDLPGSWHQQQNGGRRVWFAVSGEISSAR